MIMKNPPHPGGVVLRECIEPLGLSITDAAAALGVTRNTLSELVNEKRGISPEMAGLIPLASQSCTVHRTSISASMNVGQRLRTICMSPP